MVAIDDVLSDALGACIYEWFEPPLTHPFIGIRTVSVSESVRPLPKRWVDDVVIELHIDDHLLGENGDVFVEPGADTWTVETGKRWLRNAITRLQLSEDLVVHPNLDRMSRHELATEKRRIKQELKRYDAEFRRECGRLPGHHEKEPMRPLYAYYRQLKGLALQAEWGKPKRAHRDTLAELPELDEAPCPRDGARSSGTAQIQSQIEALTARVKSLETEKGEVRRKLQAFQDKFVAENQRKIRFHRDILPIEREYRLYKNLKEEILSAGSQLRDLQDDA